jgi:hypothetical protein
MAVLSAIRVLRLLRRSGLDPRKIAEDPKLFDDASRTVHRALPLPVRRKVSEETVRGLVRSACELARLEKSQAAAWDTANTAETVAEAAAPKTSSLSDELAKLASLHEQGVLSAEEFVAAKARLIS